MTEWYEELPEKIKAEVEEYARDNKITGNKLHELMEKVKAIYKGVVYNSQEAIGIVTAQSLSEPATQMCADYNEKVIVKMDGKIRIVRIGEFVDKAIQERHETVNGYEIYDVPKRLRIMVPSLNGKEKMEWRRVSALCRHKSPESLLEVKTDSGRSIKATDFHSFVTRRDNRIVPMAGKDLQVGDRIPAMKHMRENCTHELSTRLLIGGQQYAKKPLPDRLELSKELGWLFGAYLSEGNATRFYVSFSNIDPTFLSYIRAFADSHGFTCNEYDNFRWFAPSHDIRVNSKQLSQLMKNACGTGSSSKRIPDFAYSAREEFVSGLLRGYFDGDGNVHPERKLIRVSSNSKELLDGISMLLARFGIFAHKVRANAQHGLLIPYNYAPIFLEKIGSDVPKKRKGIERMARMSEDFWNLKSQGFTDMIGGFGDVLYRAARKLKYPTRYINNFTKRQMIGRTALYRYIRIFEAVAEEKGVDVSDELAVLRRMFESDVVWDRISGIERVKPTSGYVYDMTVEGTHTFTTFDGLVTHNTMRTYHFAGTAGIQVTLGLPRILEIFDARKEPRTPTMTILLKDEFQSIEDVKRVANNIKEIKVKDVVTSTVIDLTDMWIKCRMDKAKMAELEFDPEKLPKLVKIRNTTSRLEGDSLFVVPKKSDLENLHKLKFAVLDTHIKGIKGISQVVVNKEEGEWVISTLGSNLKKVFEIEGVDPLRTTSNNIFEIYNVLGVEAARNAIIDQSNYTLEEQGLGIDGRYVMLLADMMTYGGFINPIGRYGISGQKPSVLARASFEETKKHFVNASISNESDPLRGVVENIMMNQAAPIGTGAFVLTGHIPEIPHGLKSQAKEMGKKAKPKKASSSAKAAKKTTASAKKE